MYNSACKLICKWIYSDSIKQLQSFSNSLLDTELARERRHGQTFIIFNRQLKEGHFDRPSFSITD